MSRIDVQERRLIGADYCTWCGHPQHRPGACPEPIMTAGPPGGKNIQTDCPCVKGTPHRD